MEAIFIQNGETRLCSLDLGQKVRHPEGFWGRIVMFGEDGVMPNPRPRIMMTNDTVQFSKKRAAYPEELTLTDEDFKKGKAL